MFRHIGQRRSFNHNVRLAALLCLNAGFVNGCGFLAFAVLTTNVTGHAALLALSLAEMKFGAAGTVALWLLLFLAGTFCSGFIILKAGQERAGSYGACIFIIMGILLSVAFFGARYDRSSAETAYFAGSLLFAMGMQNAMVTMVSGSVVRSTHLTGMFTDLGLDLASLVAGVAGPPVARRVALRCTIIACFLLGGIIGGCLFVWLKFEAFYITVFLLGFTLFFDYFRVKIKKTVHDLRK